MSYMQGGVVEVWKDNLLDELAKGELEVESVEQLFTKIRNDFGEISEKERKIKQLRTIEQGGEPVISMCKSSRKLPGGATMRKDPLLKNSKGG